VSTAFGGGRAAAGGLSAHVLQNEPNLPAEDARVGAPQGSGSFTGDWQSQWLTNINKSCAVLIDLQGSGGTVRLRWY